MRYILKVKLKEISQGLGVVVRGGKKLKTTARYLSALSNCVLWRFHLQRWVKNQREELVKRRKLRVYIWSH